MKVLSVPNVFLDILRSGKTRGWKHTVMQLYTFGDIRFGELKGTDRFGNKYYEDLSAPWGQHRYVEYADIDNFDATMIQPEWHGWMHHTFDEPPQSHTFPPIDRTNTTTNVPAAYHSHMGYFHPQADAIVNKSQLKSRGYKMGPLHLGPDEADQFYLPPGHCMSKLQNKARFNTYAVEKVAREQEKEFLSEYNNKK